VAIYLDSANLADARAAAGFGFVGGFTTNPALMAREEVPGIERFSELLDVLRSGPAFYQPMSASPEEAEREARDVVALAPSRVVVKLPARRGLFPLAARLHADGLTCAMTAVYAPGQALAAHAAGAGWVIPYVDRARRLDPDGAGLVRSLAEVVGALGGGMRILAASLKDPGQAARAVVDGAHDVTLPLDVLEELGQHPLSEQAVEEFATAVEKARAG
jgi:transaldolase